MPTFSKKSAANLSTCDHHLVILFEEVVKHRDCTVTCGHRGEAAQNEAYSNKTSDKKWPNGRHNSTPSMAVDVYPFINGKISGDPAECREFAGFVLGMATAMNMGDRIRWGGDWDGDHDVHDQKLNDLVHFEMMERNK